MCLGRAAIASMNSHRWRSCSFCSSTIVTDFQQMRKKARHEIEPASHSLARYPFTAPKVMPRIRYFWANKAKIIIGTIITTLMAAIGPH